MPETKQIPTQTTVLVQGQQVTINTFYVEDTLPNTIFAQITENVGQQDTVQFTEGDLVIQMKNHPEKIFYSINSSGELIVFTNTGDASNYSIDNNGNLTWEG